MLEAHGGILVNRIVYGEERADLLSRIKEMPRVATDLHNLTEIENIATGLYSPLTGFLNQEDYDQVIEDMRLADGTVWPLPVVLRVSQAQADRLEVGSEIALTDLGDRVFAIMVLESKYSYHKEREASKVYQTTDLEHPGVANLFNCGEVILGGEIKLIKRQQYQLFNQYRFDPFQVREEFKRRGWETVVGFQTRNPIHRAHEYLQKCALEIVDGLFLSPLVGQTKSTDIPVEYRIESYEVVINKIYPPGRVFMVVFPVTMRYAGPREAIFHAICRKNYGCTHFIVGRDHAGIGDYYGTYQAQEVFDLFRPEEIGIVALKFEYSFYCRKCQSMATAKTCPHDRKYHLGLSGTKVRSLLQDGKRPPHEMTRPEVADVLIRGLKNTARVQKVRL